MPRCPAGWVKPQDPGGYASLPLREVCGFSISRDTQQLRLSFRRASPAQHGLISWEDLAVALQLRPDEALPVYLALSPPSDGPDGAFPLCEVDMIPSRLRGSAHFSTLVQADVLLKFFAIGMEASALPPFQSRPFMR